VTGAYKKANDKVIDETPKPERLQLSKNLGLCNFNLIRKEGKRERHMSDSREVREKEGDGTIAEESYRFTMEHCAFRGEGGEVR